MAQNEPRPGSRASRLIGGSLVALAWTLLAVALCAAGVVALLSHAWSSRQDKLLDLSRSNARRSAEQHQTALATAAADGKLPDSEIDQVLGLKWKADRFADRWSVTSEELLSTGSLCFRFDISLPLGPDAQVTHSELPECPAIGFQPDPSRHP